MCLPANRAGQSDPRFVRCAVVRLGWGSEAVICAWGMRDDAVNETALQIRETTSALVYAIAVLPLFGAWGFTAAVVPSLATGVVGLAALAGTVSYLFYYKSISSPIGAAKSMALQYQLFGLGRPVRARVAGNDADADIDRLLRGHLGGHCIGRKRLERAVRP